MTTVRYLVNDVVAAIEFYSKHLGFSLEERLGPGFAIVTKDGMRLWLSGPQSSAARTLSDGREPEAGGWNRFVVEVGNLAERVALMTKAGVTFRSEIISGPGGQQILADDPSG